MAKKSNIKVYELQHGVTHSETILYSGPYQKEIDPDYFLNFGANWIGKQFSIPIEKQINIGWAYNNWILKKIDKKHTLNSVLVVSSPSITNQIVKTITDLASIYKDYTFTLRLHPQEELNLNQTRKLEAYMNIKLDDKTVDSLDSIISHQFIVGENSSVLYEALNLGKTVGKIKFNGLSPITKLDKNDGQFIYLNSKEDFLKLLVKKSNRLYSGIYDKFDIEKFNLILKNKI